MAELALGIFVWIVILIQWTAMTISIVCFIQFWKFRDKLIVRKRYPKIYIPLLLLMITDCFTTPSWLLYISNVIKWDGFGVITTIFYPTIAIGIPYILFFKFYLMFYSLNKCKDLSANQWKILINSESTQSHSWFIMNQKTYGNIQWLFTRAVILLIILITISYIFWGLLYIDEIYFFVPVVYDLSIVLIMCVLFILMKFKLPKYYDNAFVASEFNIGSIICCFILSGKFIYMILFGAKISGIGKIICVCLNAAMIGLSYSALMILLTKYMLNKLRPYLYNQNTEQLQDSLMINQLEYVKSKSILRNEVEENKQMINTVNQVLSIDDDIFNIFANHLNKEFSLECILAFIELSQFIQLIITSSNDNNIDNVNVDIDNLTSLYLFTNKFPSSTPKSKFITDELKNVDSNENIVYNGNVGATKESIVNIFANLYKKYIKIGSEFEINISSKLRKDITQLIGNYHTDSIKDNDVEIIAKLCILATNEMYKYLSYSFSRFKTTKEYTHMIATHSNIIEKAKISQLDQQD